MSSLLLALALPALAAAQAGTYSGEHGTYTVTQDTSGDIPLVSKHFKWPELPYQADTGNGPRGLMQGYNICNSTTQNQDSMCVTAVMNSLEDFCLWGSPEPNELVGNVEGEMVAYCTKKRWGARLLSANALQGVQWITTPDYVEVVGYIDQATLGLQPTDGGGEEDSHGADNRGNPLGSLLYSTAFNGTNPGVEMTQISEWSFFIGNGVFCFKACDPNGPAKRSPEFCQHIYDTVGCNYNAPADYANLKGKFESCKGENQMPAGQYVNQGGATTTWIQSEGAPPYTASIPASSECTTYTSASIWPELLNAGQTSSGASGATGGTGAQPTATDGASSSEDDGGSAAAPGVVQAGSGAAFWMGAITLSAIVCGFALV